MRVSNDEICAAIKDVFDDTRSIMEPAGALAVAGLRSWVERTGTRDARLVAVLSGANMNFDRLRFVAERAEVGEAREALFGGDDSRARRAPSASSAPRIGRRVVTEFNYRLSGREQAHIFVGIATESRQDAADLATTLTARGYETVDLTDNELAKLHVRHMVGGRSPDVANERSAASSFPSGPGALMTFLDKLGGRWNISLFHYRNHGADFGRVLAGFEVPPEDSEAFEAFLDGLGYRYQREHETPRTSCSWRRSERSGRRQRDQNEGTEQRRRNEENWRLPTVAAAGTAFRGGPMGRRASSSPHPAALAPTSVMRMWFDPRRSLAIGVIRVLSFSSRTPALNNCCSVALQSAHRLDPCRAARRDDAGDRCRERKSQRGSRHNDDVEATDADEHLGERDRDHYRQQHSDRDACACEEEPVADYEPQNVAGCRAERHPNADLSRALGDDVRLDAIDAHHSQSQCKEAEPGKELCTDLQRPELEPLVVKRLHRRQREDPADAALSRGSHRVLSRWLRAP